MEELLKCMAFLLPGQVKTRDAQGPELSHSKNYSVKIEGKQIIFNS